MATLAWWECGECCSQLVTPALPRYSSYHSHQQSTSTLSSWLVGGGLFINSTQMFSQSVFSKLETGSTSRGSPVLHLALTLSPDSRSERRTAKTAGRQWRQLLQLKYSQALSMGRFSMLIIDKVCSDLKPKLKRKLPRVVSSLKSHV